MSLNRHLQLRGATWHLHWNVPKPLRDTALFRSKTVYAKSLRTKDIHEARKMRDVIISEFESMTAAVSMHSARRSFMENYARAKQASVELVQQLTLDPSPLTEQASYEAHLVEQGNYAEAYIESLNTMPDVPAAITLHEATQRFIKAHEGKVDKGVLSRARHATKGLLRVVDDKHITLAEVTPRHVLRWMNSTRDEVSDGTRNGYMSAMHQVWQWTWENEQVDGASPFKGHKIPRNGDAGSYEDFTVAEVKSLVATASPSLRELMRFGLVTGCRLSELVGLSPASFTLSDGVHAIQIFEGKTKAAARTIPMPAANWDSLKQIVESGLWATCTAQAWSQKFGYLKLKATGKKDRSKGFHSFRHMAATAYERVHMEERIVSVILGHKNKRGESMSYGLYSAGLAPKQYLEAVEKMLAGEYMQSFLKLFPA